MEKRLGISFGGIFYLRLRALVIQKILTVLFFVGSFSLHSHPIAGDLLLIQLSDFHSNYPKFETLIPNLIRIKKQFLNRNPEGKTVLVLNGDIFGISEWAEDRGQLAVDIFSRLAHQFEIIYVPGNHEGFDWHGYEGNDLFLKQLAQLSLEGKIKPERQRIYATVANMIPQDWAAKYFRKYHDIEIQGAKWRVVGFVLDDFFEHSTYDPRQQNSLIKEITPFNEEVKKQILHAAQDGITHLVISNHERYAYLLRKMDALLTWKKEHSDKRVRDLRIVAGLAAHDHLYYEGEVQGVPLFDARSQGEFMVLEFSANGDLFRKNYYDLASQENFANKSYLNQGWRRVLREARNIVAELREYNSEVLGQTPGLNANKQNLKAGPHILGTKIADSFVDWAKDNFSLPEGTLVVGFFNSSSYRKDDKIEKGDVTRGLVAGISPFPGYPRAIRINGHQLKVLFETLMAKRKAIREAFTPQVSSNLEVQDGSIFLKQSDGRLAPLTAAQDVILAMDDWLSLNGYKVDEWEEILTNAQFLKASKAWTQQEVLIRYLPPHLKSFRCSDSLRMAS